MTYFPLPAGGGVGCLAPVFFFVESFLHSACKGSALFRCAPIFRGVVCLGVCVLSVLLGGAAFLSLPSLPRCVRSDRVRHGCRLQEASRLAKRTSCVPPCRQRISKILPSLSSLGSELGGDVLVVLVVEVAREATHERGVKTRGAPCFVSSRDLLEHEDGIITCVFFVSFRVSQCATALLVQRTRGRVSGLRFRSAALS